MHGPKARITQCKAAVDANVRAVGNLDEVRPAVSQGAPPLPPPRTRALDDSSAAYSNVARAICKYQCSVPAWLGSVPVAAIGEERREHRPRA